MKFNFFVSHVYDIRFTKTNLCSLLHNCGCGVKGILLVISLCGYF